MVIKAFLIGLKRLPKELEDRRLTSHLGREEVSQAFFKVDSVLH